MDWKEKLYACARTDPWYQTCLAELRARTPQYECILESLPPEQQDAVEAYIAACEELDHALLLLAFELGGSSL